MPLSAFTRLGVGNSTVTCKNLLHNNDEDHQIKQNSQTTHHGFYFHVNNESTGKTLPASKQI